MALIRGESQITWTGAASVTLSAATRQDSDVYTFHDGDIAASVQIDANNAGTPASGDVLDVYIKWTTGDVLGDSGNDYDTSEHAQLLGRLDTVAANTPGEDPARKTWDIPVGARGFVLSVEAPQAASRNIVVRARLSYQRSS